MSTTPSAHCFCGSALSFGNCCLPRLNGTAPAETCEQLMRSRYSAFCRADIDYLIATHHPSQRHPNDHQALAESAKNCRWLTLRIINSSSIDATSTEGEVEFIASYLQDEQPGLLHENSRFIKEQGQWFYLDGELFTTQAAALKPGRNDPCWCGSSKKFKKCHG